MSTALRTWRCSGMSMMRRSVPCRRGSGAVHRASRSYATTSRSCSTMAFMMTSVDMPTIQCTMKLETGRWKCQEARPDTVSRNSGSAKKSRSTPASSGCSTSLRVSMAATRANMTVARPCGTSSTTPGTCRAFMAPASTSAMSPCALRAHQSAMTHSAAARRGAKAAAARRTRT